MSLEDKKSYAESKLNHVLKRLEIMSPSDGYHGFDVEIARQDTEQALDALKELEELVSNDD